MTKIPTKLCVVCKVRYPKSPSDSKNYWRVRKCCSRKCANVFKKTIPAHNKGTIYTKRREHNAAKRIFRKCCVCGAPTKYVMPKVKKKQIPVRCDKQECINIVRLQKNKRIAKARKHEWKTGQRVAANNPWAKATRISKEELLMKDWFIEHGWTPQYHINTGVRIKHVFLYYDLDFALISQKLYVEIDGSVHNGTRLIKDARRTKILDELGWRGLRISANRVISRRKRTPADIEGVKKEVIAFMSNR